MFESALQSDDQIASASMTDDIQAMKPQLLLHFYLLAALIDGERRVQRLGYDLGVRARLPMHCPKKRGAQPSSASTTNNECSQLRECEIGVDSHLSSFDLG